MIVKDSSLSVPCGGGDVEVKVETNVPFDVTPEVDWIHFVQTKGMSSATVCLTVDENKSYGSRVGTVKITQKNGSLVQTVTIFQQEIPGLYGIWRLEKRTDAVPQSDGSTKTTETDYTNVNFFLALSNTGVPHALAKKGSFTAGDLGDVDVDGTIFTYNADLKQMSFRERLWLTELPNYSMELKGTYDVLELTPGTLVIQQKSLLEVKTYYFKKVE